MKLFKYSAIDLPDKCIGALLYSLNNAARDLEKLFVNITFDITEYCSELFLLRLPCIFLLICVYCIIKFPKVAEAIPQSCRGNFPNNAAVFGASLSLLGW